MSLFMGVGWLGWLITLTAAAVVIIYEVRRSRIESEGGEVGEQAPTQSVAWGLLFAGVAYIMYQHYSAADVSSFVTYVRGDGLIFIALGLLAAGGYAANRAAGQADDARSFVMIVRDTVYRPVEQVAGTAIGVVMSLTLILVAVATMGAELLGFIGGMYALEPGFATAIVSSIVGYIGLGGEVPLLQPWIPEYLKTLNPLQYFGIVLLLFGLGLTLWSDSFREASRGR